MSKKSDFEHIQSVQKKLLSNASDIDYVRVNITLPIDVLDLLDKEYKDTPRSRVLAQLILSDLIKHSKERFLQEEAEKLAERKEYYTSLVESLNDGIYD